MAIKALYGLLHVSIINNNNKKKKRKKNGARQQYTNFKEHGRYCKNLTTGVVM